MQVIHASGDHADGAWDQVMGLGSQEAVALHVVHLSMKAFLQPIEQGLFCVREVNGRDTDL